MGIFSNIMGAIFGHGSPAATAATTGETAPAAPGAPPVDVTAILDKAVDTVDIFGSDSTTVGDYFLIGHEVINERTSVQSALLQKKLRTMAGLSAVTVAYDGSKNAYRVQFASTPSQVLQVSGTSGLRGRGQGPMQVAVDLPRRHARELRQLRAHGVDLRDARFLPNVQDT